MKIEDCLKEQEELVKKHSKVVLEVLVDFAVDKKIVDNQGDDEREREANYLRLLKELNIQDFIYTYWFPDTRDSHSEISWTNVFKTWTMAHWKDVRRK